MSTNIKAFLEARVEKRNNSRDYADDICIVVGEMLLDQPEPFRNCILQMVIAELQALQGVMKRESPSDNP